MALALLASACTQSDPQTALLPPLVRTVPVGPGAQAPLELRASVAVQSRVRLGFKQPGVVEEVLVHEGDRVATGRIVARLDDLDAQSLVRAAQASRDKARRDAERAARLAQEGALATSVRDDAGSQLEAAEAQLAQAEDALERTRLRAPVAGTVFMRLAEPGETVGAGTPVVVLDTTAALEAVAGATERELKDLRLGQRALLTPEDGGAPIPGRVTTLASTPNPADGLYGVEVRPEGAPARRLRPGALLRIRFEGTRETAGWCIPLDALVHRQDRDFVFVVEAGAGSPTVRLRPIEVGEVEGIEVTVRSGLEGGERVVAEGAYFLQDGQVVRLLDQP